MYQAQFISTGIVAFSAQERGIVAHWIDCNNYAPERPMVDPDTGEYITDGEGNIQWTKGDCLGLFKLVKVQR